MRLLRCLPLLLSVVIGHAAPPPAIVAAPAGVHSQPLVTLEIAGKGVPLLVDTGSAVPLVLFPGLILGKSGSTMPVELKAPGSAGLLAEAALMLPSTTSGAKGILGWPVLKHSVWRLDLPAGKHEFLKALPAEAKSWISFPIVEKRESLAFQHPSLGEVYVDSGARRGVCLSASRWALWKKAHPEQALTLAEGTSPSSPGGAFANEAAYEVPFEVAPLVLKNTSVGEAFFDPAHDDASILLGLDALVTMTMIVDGPGGRIYFQPSAREPVYEPLPANRLQTAFLPDPGFTNGLYVKVLPDSAGGRAGLQTGDLVVSLNGSAVPPSFATMHELVRKSDTDVKLRVLRQGQPVEIRFVMP